MKDPGNEFDENLVHETSCWGVRLGGLCWEEGSYVIGGNAVAWRPSILLSHSPVSSLVWSNWPAMQGRRTKLNGRPLTLFLNNAIRSPILTPWSRWFFRFWGKGGKGTKDERSSRETHRSEGLLPTSAYVYWGQSSSALRPVPKSFSFNNNNNSAVFNNNSNNSNNKNNYNINFISWITKLFTGGRPSGLGDRIIQFT